MKKSFRYYAILDRHKSPGVYNKINNNIKAALVLGFNAKSEFFDSNEKAKFLKEIWLSKSDFIFIRYPGWFSIFLTFCLIKKRLQGIKIIIDVPTPRSIGLEEIKVSGRSKIKKILAFLVEVLAGSWVLFPANKIIQYAEESCFFSLGIKNKIIKMGNGIVVDDDIPLLHKVKSIEGLNLIAVAQLADWHGYDRLIKSVSMIQSSHPSYNITLTIVGAGSALKSLKELTKKLKLYDVVSFTGLQYGETLANTFNNKDVAISSLGLYRKGLDEASDLKTREYMARGLCVIGVGKDPDFPENSPYRFTVPNNSTIESLNELLLSMYEKELPDPQEVRDYAIKKLSLEGKIKYILDRV